MATIRYPASLPGYLQQIARDRGIAVLVIAMGLVLPFTVLLAKALIHDPAGAMPLSSAVGLAIALAMLIASVPAYGAHALILERARNWYPECGRYHPKGLAVQIMALVPASLRRTYCQIRGPFLIWGVFAYSAFLLLRRDTGSAFDIWMAMIGILVLVTLAIEWLASRPGNEDTSPMTLSIQGRQAHSADFLSAAFRGCRVLVWVTLLGVYLPLAWGGDWVAREVWQVDDYAGLNRLYSLCFALLPAAWLFLAGERLLFWRLRECYPVDDPTTGQCRKPRSIPQVFGDWLRENGLAWLVAATFFGVIWLLSEHVFGIDNFMLVGYGVLAIFWLLALMAGGEWR